jgi:hypothetical protein
VVSVAEIAGVSRPEIFVGFDVPIPGVAAAGDCAGLAALKLQEYSNSAGIRRTEILRIREKLFIKSPLEKGLNRLGLHDRGGLRKVSYCRHDTLISGSNKPWFSDRAAWFEKSTDCTKEHGVFF